MKHSTGGMIMYSVTVLNTWKAPSPYATALHAHGTQWV